MTSPVATFRAATTRRARLLAIAATILGTACSQATGTSRTAATPEAARYDVVITGGRIVDGTGNAWFYGDVGLRDGRIARITTRGSLASAPAGKRVDATGMVVSPGFIDIQGQSGFAFLFGDGRNVGKLMQGVTTEILGEGSTPAPVNNLTIGDEEFQDSSVAKTINSFRGEHGFDTWLRAMEKHGISSNVGSFVGAGTIREYGMGMRQGAATGIALDSMRAAVRRAMVDGAFGMASALIYPPNNYASTEELVEEAKAMSPFGGVYITHMRSEADTYLEAIDEAMRIGREGGVPVEIYHLKAAGKANWPKGPRAIAKIDSARATGLDVQADMYPYTAGGTGLTACLPPWSAADGKLFANLADPAMRTKIKTETLHKTFDWENLCDQATPQGVLITALHSPAWKSYAGKRLSDIATAYGKDWVETAMDMILAEHDRVETIFFIASEENVKLQLAQPWIKIGTDAGGHDPDSTKSLVHPRSYGTYPRILGKYVREEHVLTLEDAVRKMSAAVAERLSIKDRGSLREGMYADVVVFDPATIAEHGTYENPNQLATGVRNVFVNGVEVVSDGKHTGAKPGRIVRGPGWTER
jgi:dihydroorotase/N-acyl-D-amino-acid deacylase